MDKTPRAAKRIFGPQGKGKLGTPPPILQIMILKLSPPRCVISKESVCNTSELMNCDLENNFVLICLDPFDIFIKLVAPGSPYRLTTPLSVGLKTPNPSLYDIRVSLGVYRANCAFDLSCTTFRCPPFFVIDYCFKRSECSISAIFGTRTSQIFHKSYIEMREGMGQASQRF